MIVVPSDLENAPITIEFQGAAEQLVDELRRDFAADDEDVIYSHGFGGAGAVVVISTLTAKTLHKLIAFWEKVKTSTPKTSIKIGKSSVAIAGFTQAETEALLKTPALRDAIKALNK